MPLINGKFHPIQLPEKAARVLLDQSKPWRYRALWGGRNGGKDWSFAAAAVERSLIRRERILCTREIQHTLSDSIHQLLCDTIERLGYSGYFKISDKRITCNYSGSYFVFKGLQDLNADNVKSIEGITIAIIGEAQYLTPKSFDILDPSVRGCDNPEIWIEFNPQFIDDFVYQFCVEDPPDNLIGGEILYTDNPWTSKSTYEIAERKRIREPDLYEWIWLGRPIGAGGRVYPMYKSEVHLIDFDYSYLKECDLYMSIDPHRKYYPAIGWYAVTPSGCIVKYNEWPKREDVDCWYDELRKDQDKPFDMSMEQLANIILSEDLTLQYGGKIISRIGDPRFLAENVDYTAELTKYGVGNWVDAPHEKIETQRNNLRQMMNYNTEIPLIGHNLPEYYVAKQCRNSDRCYKRHHWEEEKDKESEEYKDNIDTDRYFLSVHNGQPRFIERKTVSTSQQLISPTQYSLDQLPAGRLE